MTTLNINCSHWQ